MLKLKTLILALVFPVLIFAQLDKGNYILGGCSSFKFYKIAENDTLAETKWLSYNLNPQLGYFINDNLPIGIEFCYSSKYNNYITKDKSSNKKIISFNPFIRYYFYKSLFINSQFGYGIGFANSGEDNQEADNINKFYCSLFDIGFGNSFFYNNTIAFDINIRYHIENLKYMDNVIEPENIKGIKLLFGFQIFLNPKKNKTNP